MKIKSFIFIALSCLVSACSIPKSKIDSSTETLNPQTPEERRENNMKSILTKSDEPLVIYSSKKKGSGGGGGGGNSGIAGSYIWKAALESISFMPLISVDSNGGVILTDWYQAPDSKNERIKFNIIILSSDLQLKSIKVTAFRQVETFGKWSSTQVSTEFSTAVEDNILRKAIAMRAAAENE